MKTLADDLSGLLKYQCGDCKGYKLKEQFSKRTDGAYGIQHYCKGCMKTRDKRRNSTPTGDDILRFEGEAAEQCRKAELEIITEELYE